MILAIIGVSLLGVGAALNLISLISGSYTLENSENQGESNIIKLYFSFQAFACLVGLIMIGSEKLW